MRNTKFFITCNKDKSIIDKFLDDDAPELEEEIDEETEKLLKLLEVEIDENEIEQLDLLEIYESESENELWELEKYDSQRNNSLEIDEMIL